mgnify:CR=1 FL=1
MKASAVAVPVALPWMTGSPYAVYARVRAITPKGVSGWSASFGFNVRWGGTPQPLPTMGERPAPSLVVPGTRATLNLYFSTLAQGTVGLIEVAGDDVTAASASASASLPAQAPATAITKPTRIAPIKRNLPVAAATCVAGKGSPGS